MRHSKASLFLMEIMLSILFFSITAVVCVQLFVKAHSLNIDTENLSKATFIAQNLSEFYLNGDIFQQKSMREQMVSHLPDYSTSENHIIIFYNKKWVVCKEEEAVFSTELIFHEDGEYTYMSIDISEIKTNEVIYNSCVKKHSQRRIDL